MFPYSMLPGTHTALCVRPYMFCLSPWSAIFQGGRAGTAEQRNKKKAENYFESICSISVPEWQMTTSKLTVRVVKPFWKTAYNSIGFTYRRRVEI